jgi:hypothetical protein
MLMQVDEARSDDQPARIEYASADKRFGTHTNDLPVINTDIADGVEPRLRVHNPATLHDQVVGLRKRRRSEQEQRPNAREYPRRHAAPCTTKLQVCANAGAANASNAPNAGECPHHHAAPGTTFSGALNIGLIVPPGHTPSATYTGVHICSND